MFAKLYVLWRFVLLICLSILPVSLVAYVLFGRSFASICVLALSGLVLIGVLFSHRLILGVYRAKKINDVSIERLRTSIASQFGVRPYVYSYVAPEPAFLALKIAFSRKPLFLVSQGALAVTSEADLIELFRRGFRRTQETGVFLSGISGLFVFFFFRLLPRGWQRVTFSSQRVFWASEPQMTAASFFRFVLLIPVLRLFLWLGKMRTTAETGAAVPWVTEPSFLQLHLAL